MLLSRLSEMLSLTALTPQTPDQEVRGVYAGDLLSWVLTHARAGDAWVSIMSNHIVAAVALTAELSCVILAEGVSPDPQLLSRAKETGLALFSSPLGVSQLCWQLHQALMYEENAAPDLP